MASLRKPDPNWHYPHWNTPSHNSSQQSTLNHSNYQFQHQWVSLLNLRQTTYQRHFLFSESISSIVDRWQSDLKIGFLGLENTALATDHNSDATYLGFRRFRWERLHWNRWGWHHWIHGVYLLGGGGLEKEEEQRKKGWWMEGDGRVFLQRYSLTEHRQVRTEWAKSQMGLTHLHYHHTFNIVWTMNNLISIYGGWHQFPRK